MDKFQSSYSKYVVLCFDCGGTFEVSYETKNPTKQCKKCNGILKS